LQDEVLVTRGSNYVSGKNPPLELLRIFYLPDSKRKSVLRDDIRIEIRKKETGSDNERGDFYGPF
jgi:hypothetical protein